MPPRIHIRPLITARRILVATCPQRRLFGYSFRLNNSIPPYNKSCKPISSNEDPRKQSSTEADASSEILERTNELINTLETQKKLLAEDSQKTVPSPKSENQPSDQHTKQTQQQKPSSQQRQETNTKLYQYLNSITESENYQSLKDELTKFNDNRLKKQNEYSDSLHKRLETYATELSGSVKVASNLVNDITGYTKVMVMKEKIVEKEANLRNLRRSITDAKAAYNKSVDDRSDCQKGINELLERKHSWGSSDLERFTNLYKSDHDLEKKVHETLEKVNALESREDETHNELIQAIMNRYHEEQVWSDKIRQFSTWGTVLIMCVNFLMILMVQFVFEPWKRYRLVNSFEGKVRELFANNEKMGNNLIELKGEIEQMNRQQEERLNTWRQEQAEQEERINKELETNKHEVQSLLPTGFSLESFKSWFKHVFSLLNPFSSSISENSDIVQFTKQDFQHFVFSVTSLFFGFGLLIKSVL